MAIDYFCWVLLTCLGFSIRVLKAYNAALTANTRRSFLFIGCYFHHHDNHKENWKPWLYRRSLLQNGCNRNNWSVIRAERFFSAAVVTNDVAVPLKRSSDTVTFQKTSRGLYASAVDYHCVHTAIIGVIWTHQQNSYDSVWNFTALRHWPCWPYNVSTTCISERKSSSYFFEYWKCATASKWSYICVLLCYADIVVLYILMDAAWSLSGSDLMWQGFFF